MYIGKTPTVGNFQVCDAISVVNGQAAYTLQVGGVNVAPESANHMLVSLNGILQKPGSSFTISGSTMTFASNLATGDVIDFVQILGNVLDIGQPSDDTVTAAKLNNDIISGQTALTSAPDDTDELLISDAGTIKRIDVSLVSGSNTPNFHAYVSGNQSIANSTFQTVIFNVEYFDSASAYNVSDGKFTVPSGKAGKYLFTFNLRAGAWEAPRFITVFAKNGTDVSYFEHAAADSNERVSKGGSIIMDLAVSDYITIKLYQTSGSAQNITGSSNQSSNFFTGMKLI
jgi:hypothetical protein